jgi:C4-dicarboxylate-specific signal transduction histidine kinase/ActR/RegA family two-component response regulator
MSIYAYGQERRSAIRREFANIQALSQELATRIDLSLASGKILAVHLASTRDVTDYLGQSGHSEKGQKTCQDWLDLQIRQTPGISSIFLLSPTGDCLVSTTKKYIGHNYSFRPYFQESAAGRLFLSDWSVGLLSGIPHIDSSAPVRLQGKVVGVLVTEFSVDTFEKAMRSAGADGRIAVIINRDGIALAHSNPAFQYHALKHLDASVLAELKNTHQFMGRDIPTDLLSPGLAKAFKESQETSRQQNIIYQFGASSNMGVLTPLVEKDWVILMAISQKEILLPMYKAMVRTLLVGLAIALVGILAAFTLVRSLLGSIRKLSNAMQQFGAGDITARAPVLNQDERGQLSQAFNDMADSIQAHQERLEKLESQNMESLGTLVAGVAHNINNVLAIIMGTASMREDIVTEPSDIKAYHTIGKVCRRGRDVVKSLIAFANPTLSTQVPFELNALIEEACALLESTIKNRIKIIETFADESLWINGDAGSINHVLLNLCLNAIDAMPDVGTLSLRTSILDGNWVEVSIEDNGTGMTPEILARVIEPFYTTKKVGKGIGLGLSMTYGVIKAHGGSVDIASQPGQGTTVKIQFPRIPAPVESKPGPANARALPPKLRKVLLVDDEEDVRFLMTRMLKKAGVGEVETAAGGEEATEKLLSGELPNLIILDLNMPGLNGTQTLKLIRQLCPDLPILISSGQPDIEECPDFKQPNVGVISKPFTMKEIQAKLAQFAHEPVLANKSEPLSSSFSTTLSLKK